MSSPTTFKKAQTHDVAPDQDQQEPMAIPHTSKVTTTILLSSVTGVTGAPVPDSQSRGSHLLSTHSEQQPRENQNEENQSNPIEKPWYLWVIGLVDSVLGALFGIRMFYNKYQGKNIVDPIFRGKPVMPEFVTMLVFLRNLSQFLAGIGMLWGLLTSQESRTIFCLKAWIRGSYFIFCEISFFLMVNITKVIAIQVDESIGWSRAEDLLGNIFDMLLRILTFYFVSKFLSYLKHRSRLQQLGHVVPPPQQVLESVF